MGRTRVVMGECCICGKNGSLSLEHVPPQAAYNKERVVEYALSDVVHKTGAKGRTRQGGIGQHTLCDQCNNDTGSWYGNEYVTWARIGQAIIQEWQKNGQTEGMVTLLKGYPLRFLKQVVTCFFSVVGAPGGGSFARNNPALVKFVQDKYEQELPDYRFFVDLYPLASGQNTSLRRYPIAAKISVVMDAQRNIIPVTSSVFHEFTHPPFALAMTTDLTFFGATDITHFKNYGYDNCVDVALPLRIIPSTSYLPGAFR